MMKIVSKAQSTPSSFLPFAFLSGNRSASALAFLIVAIGFGLRVLGAQGDLWLDEIWSLDLVGRIGWAGEILWGINHDNNHFLNSLHLHLLGPDASPLLYRSQSVTLGTATIAAAGLVARRGGPAAAFTAMTLFTLSYPLVHYGSEARGYAGLVFFTVLALLFLERHLLEDDRKARIWLGLAVGLGLLSHLTMAVAALSLAFWTAWVAWRQTGSLKQAEARTRDIFSVALRGAILIAAFIAFGSYRHGFTIGGATPFTTAQFINGYGGLIRQLIGLPEQAPPLACIAAAVAVTILYAVSSHRFAADRRRSIAPRATLYIIAVIVMPAAIFALQVPNVQFPRYFLVSGAIFLLVLADLAGLAWRMGRLFRISALAGLAAFIAGNAVSLSYFFELSRGHYSQATARMASTGAVVYGSDHDFRNTAVADYFFKRANIDASYVPFAEWCRTPPDWLLMHEFSPQTAQGRMSIGPADCPYSFTLREDYPYWGLSGWRWLLYQRMENSAP